MWGAGTDQDASCLEQGELLHTQGGGHQRRDLQPAAGTAGEASEGRHTGVGGCCVCYVLLPPRRRTERVCACRRSVVPLMAQLQADHPIVGWIEDPIISSDLAGGNRDEMRCVGGVDCARPK